VQFVEGGGAAAPFAYTVGLTTHGLAELVITAKGTEESGRLLNSFAAYLMQGDNHFHAGDTVLMPDGQRAEIVDLPHPDAHLFTAVNLYGDQVLGQQIVWPDSRGNLPWSPGFRGRRWKQPVLGPRSARFR
jgi:hypothetical protein